jgi:uncharacterized protein (DUF1778 family)
MLRWEIIIELRTTREEKRLIPQPGAREQLDVTCFIMRSVPSIARGAVRIRIVLSERDSKRVLELLEKPPRPRPTEALIVTGRRHAQGCGRQFSSKKSRLTSDTTGGTSTAGQPN